MKRHGRHQQGYVFRKGNGWYLRYYQGERQPDGSERAVQKCTKLADYGGEYRSKSAVRILADEFLAPFNNGTTTVDSLMSLTDFIEKRYLPYVKEHKAPSTYAGYRNLWSLYIEDRGTMALRDYRTCECDDLLLEIARAHDTAKETIKRVKSFLSGTFRHAKRLGVLNTENPMWDTVLPECREGEDTYAYSLSEILTMLESVPEPAATMIAVAGIRRPSQWRTARACSSRTAMGSRSSFRSQRGGPMCASRKQRPAALMCPSSLKSVPASLGTWPAWARQPRD